ncbi:MAG: hypothetical protein U0R44_04770 [Candidatus Micrarchaeia archaeon]
MRPLILVLVPVVLFIGALMSAGSHPQAAPQKKAPEPMAQASPDIFQPAAAVSVQDTSDQTEMPDASAPAAVPPQAQPQKTYVRVRTCTGGGVTTYETGDGIQVQPVGGRSPQCQDPVVLLKDGKRYFGCTDGKIILDCDIFVQSDGSETEAENLTFGSSYVIDLQVPPTADLSCSDELVDPGRFLKVGGNVCDLSRLVGNLNQMHGG